MRQLLVGVLLASLPFALLAQNLPGRPPRNNSVTTEPLPPVDQVLRGPSRDPILRGQSPAPILQGAPDDSVLRGPSHDPVTATPEPTETPTTEAPPDDSVTATPLPPPPPADNPTDSSQEMVPNPLDNLDALPAPGAGKQGEVQGHAQPGGWVQMGTATLQALDKVNAASKTLVVKVGDTAEFGSLDIAVRGCFVRPTDRPADATAFLVIRDHRPDAPSFTGWMVRSAPYMSMMAHPIYDIHVAGCTP
jgi:hypothetical protein